MTTFAAPCTKYYGCSKESAALYTRDATRIDFLRCGSCGLIWRDTTTCDEEGVYDGRYFHLHGYDRARRHKINKSHMLIGMLEAYTDPGRLLEIGPSLGYTMEAARARGWQVEGLDISDHAIACTESMGLPVSKGDLLNCGHLKGGYDAIFMKHVLEHYRDPFAALVQARTLLDDAGLIDIIVPNAEYRRAKRQKERSKFYAYGTEHFIYFDRKTLQDMLEFTGFEVLQEGLPLTVKGANSPKALADRILRKSMTLIDMDQEIFMIARKTRS